jgi:hypothetical protein
VAIIYDATQAMHDRYGRTLACLVKGDGWNYSVEAARAGTAHAYIYDNSRSKGTRKSLPQNKRPGPLAAGCGDRRAAARQHQCRSKMARLYGLLSERNTTNRAAAASSRCTANDAAAARSRARTSARGPSALS